MVESMAAWLEVNLVVSREALLVVEMVGSMVALSGSRMADHLVVLKAVMMVAVWVQNLVVHLVAMKVASMVALSAGKMVDLMVAS